MNVFMREFAKLLTPAAKEEQRGFQQSGLMLESTANLATGVILAITVMSKLSLAYFFCICVYLQSVETFLFIKPRCQSLLPKEMELFQKKFQCGGDFKSPRQFMFAADC